MTDATLIQMVRAECAIVFTLHDPEAHRNLMNRLSAIRANPSGKAERCEMLITDAFAVANPDTFRKPAFVFQS